MILYFTWPLTWRLEVSLLPGCQRTLSSYPRLRIHTFVLTPLSGLFFSYLSLGVVARPYGLALIDKYGPGAGYPEARAHWHAESFLDHYTSFCPVLSAHVHDSSYQIPGHIHLQRQPAQQPDRILR